MAAYIEIEPSDRLIFMLGQPSIDLVASGGPGGALGSVPVSMPTSSSVPWGKERAMPGRSGLYPKKLRDMVSFDMGMGCCGSMPSLADLGCCGRDREDMSDALAKAASIKAKQLVNHCKNLEKHVANVKKAITEAMSNKKLTPAQRANAVAMLRSKIDGLRATFASCASNLEQIVAQHGELLKDKGMSGLLGDAEDQITIQQCREELAKLKAAQKGPSENAAPAAQENAGVRGWVNRFKGWFKKS